MSGNPEKDRLSTQELDDDLEEFLIDRESRNLTPKTLQWYEHSLGIWRDYLVQLGTGATRDVTPSTLRHFLVHLSERGHSAGGVANVYGAVKAFLNWYGSEFASNGWENPLHKVKTPRKPTELIQPLPLEHFRAMVKTCRRRTFAGDRDRALLLFLLDTGIRHQELTDLVMGDVDQDTGQVIIRSGKGRKTRFVFMGAKTRRAVRAYLRHRPGLEPTDPMWAKLNGDGLTKSGLRQVIRRRAAQAGIADPAMHGFRRAFAINALRAGMDVVTLQRLLGHSSLNVINRYLALVGDDLRAVHGRTGPVDNMPDI